MAMEYNLLDEGWIPVLYRDGRWERVGIRKALEEADQIRQIAASNPMDNVALLRFLLAVLVWCRGELTENDRKRLEGETDGIPGDWLKKLDEYKEKFKLLGDERRFYQDKSILDDLLTAKQKKWDDQRKKAKSQKAPKTPRPTSLDDDDFRPVGDLLIEFPTETKIAHLRHVRDKEYGFCPGCCALGIVRFSTFANAYGGGRYTSAVNGPTPAYAIPQGATLLRTLLLNWPMDAVMKRDPPWLCDEEPSLRDLDAITVFAWRSRRLWLGERGSNEEPCAYCGERDQLTKQVAFTGNWKPPFQTRGTQKKFWEPDPHLILERRAKGDSESDEEDDAASGSEREASTAPAGQVATISFPSPSRSVTGRAGFWRRALAAAITESRPTGSITVPLAITVAGPAANKGLYQDATAFSLPSISVDAQAALRIAVDFVREVTVQLVGILRQSTPNPQRQHPNRKAALDARSALLETHLRRQFDEWVSKRMPPSGARSLAFQFWREGLIEHLRPVVEGVVAATTCGSSLRREEARRLAGLALWETVKQIQNRMETFNEPDAPGPGEPNGDPPSTRSKPRRASRKGATS
jgi:hypothetical protein